MTMIAWLSFSGLKNVFLRSAPRLAFSRRLIELTGLATVPGSSFYSVKERGIDPVRFCFCKKWETLHAVAEALGKLR